MSDDYTKQTIAVYDQIAEDYAKKIDQYAPQEERAKFLHFLSAHATIYDAGCGPGRDSAYFASLGHTVTGVDLSPKLLEIARKKSPTVSFIEGDIRSHSFPADTFEGVWVCASLLHMPRRDASGVLTQFYRCMKFGGILFLSVKEGIGEAEIASELSSHLPRHFTYYTQQEIRTLVEKAGFYVLEESLWNQQMRWPERTNETWISLFARKNA